MLVALGHSVAVSLDGAASLLVELVLRVGGLRLAGRRRVAALCALVGEEGLVGLFALLARECAGAHVVSVLDEFGVMLDFADDLLFQAGDLGACGLYDLVSTYHTGG